MIQKRFIDHCQRIDLEHVPTSPKASCHPPSPSSREMNTPSWRHLIRTCPAHERTTPASLGASALLCDPDPVRRLIGINEQATRQLPRPNRIERRENPSWSARGRRSSIRFPGPWKTLPMTRTQMFENEISAFRSPVEEGINGFRKQFSVFFLLLVWILSLYGIVMHGMELDRSAFYERK